MEMFADNLFGDLSVVGLLDLMGLRYTGCGPGEFYLTQDKGLTKKILAFHNILYPRFAVFSQAADFETGGNLRMPLFVKPLRSDASPEARGHASGVGFRRLGPAEDISVASQPILGWRREEACRA